MPGLLAGSTIRIHKTSRKDAEGMRPREAEYDRYIAMVQFGVKVVGWDQTRIVADGPFLMADPGITFVLLRAHEDLAVLGRALGEDVTEIESWAAALRNALPLIWNPELGAYDAKDLRTRLFAGVLGSGAFLAYLAGASNPELDAQLIRVWDAVRYGIASADPEAAIFDPRRYWRGPTWPVIDALMAIGLRDSGRHDLEARLRAETAELIEKHGFFEYFDPTDATPCGGDNFTWTAAIWLTWAGRDLDQAKGAA
ncbi:MGH1-like glycoside hydrolase domain-containing protein [Octadecabacter antarcticus]|uniref:MGH1-like glycoside hydrolase domain-containing protein n=1 Tax=Octadecabacter antarcticus TaxID=1217908 RepID=UPI0038CD1A00